MKLSGAGEAAIIGLFRHASETGTTGLLKGIGDDAAVFSGPPDTRWLVSTDLLVEGIHFDLHTITPRQLGFKSVAVNVSDIRAMNGRTLYVHLSLALPAEQDFRDVEAFARGVMEAEQRFGVTVIGGDTCRSRSDMFVGITVLGQSANPVCRSGARAGHGLYVTGTLGDSAAGLELLARLGSAVNLERPGDEHPGTRLGMTCREEHILKVIERHVMPVPVMGEFDFDISAMIDVSDGLLVDLDRLCTESGTGVRLNADALPLSEALRGVCPEMGLDPVDLALRGGEDYELLFTAPPGTQVSGATLIGEMISEGREMIRRDQRMPWPRIVGYDHFGS